MSCSVRRYSSSIEGGFCLRHAANSYIPRDHILDSHIYIVPLSFFSLESESLTDGSVRNLITTSSFLSTGCRTTALINRDNPLRRFSKNAESPTERR